MKPAGRRWIAAVSGTLCLALVTPSWASETDILLKKLVQKGILSVEEAQEIRDEVAQEAAQEAQTRAAPSPAGVPLGKEPVPAAVPREEILRALPEWVKSWKWSGDLRLRHETQRREPATDRNRERFRLRFGFTTKPWDPLEIGVRLATGASGDPVSTNQSFTGTFDKKSILLDKAYARYTPWSWLALVGGKVDNPFHTVSETVWDADVTPEGGALQAWAPADWAVQPFGNFSAFQIAELNGDAGDPALFGAQGGLGIQLPFLGSTWKSSVGYYDFTAVEGRATGTITNAPAGNTTTAAGTFRDDFNVIAFASELAFTSILGQPLTLFGDWTRNESASDDEGAWVSGVRVGKVTEKLGSWRALYLYKRVEPDAVFGAITDSDFGGGGTNHKGHRLGLEVGLNKYVSAAITYIRTDEVEGTQNRVDTLQVDANIKY